jgi:hypothetical protein
MSTEAFRFPPVNSPGGIFLRGGGSGAYTRCHGEESVVEE